MTAPAPGLLLDGVLVDVPGVTVIPPASHGGPAWCALDARDCRARRTPWVRQVVLHTTKGATRQYVRAGSGEHARERNVAEFWHSDPAYSGAHIVVGSDGTVACLADLVRTTAYHATVSNEWSVGIELYQEVDGGIYEATLQAGVAVVLAICNALGIPDQFVADPYKGHPLPVLLDGGPDVVGVYGHRNNTEARGWGDPGEEIFARLAQAGCRPIHLANREDLEIGRKRQAWLNAEHARLGLTFAPLGVDGVLGPASVAAMRRVAKSWSSADARIAALSPHDDA